MEQNKARTYLLYAVGEILLVVIGILIAIQINTAFDNRVKAEKHQRLVDDLYSEYSENLGQLNTVIYYHQLVYDSGLRLLELILVGGEGSTQNEIRQLLYENSYRWTFDPLNGVLASSISSGDIHLLNNDSLKVMLFSWEDRVLDAREEQDRANADYNGINSYLNDHIMVADVLMHDPSGYGVRESPFQSNYWQIFKDRTYENHISNRVTYTADVLTELEPLREMNMQILQLLEEERGDL